MNIEQYDELTPEERDTAVKIALWTGWEMRYFVGMTLKETDETRHIVSPDGAQHMWQEDNYRWDVIPAYFHDLNVMHEVEKALSETKMELYVERLEIIVGINWEQDCGPDTLQPLVLATARQRAEALVKVMEDD